MNEQYEFGEPNTLIRIDDRYFQIPESIIYEQDLNERRITVFSYFSIRRGLDNNITFSINDIVKWSGRKPDRHSGAINEKVQDVIDYMFEHQYLSDINIPTHSSSVNTQFNLGLVREVCDYERFAVIYVDEVKKVLSYCETAPKDAFHNIDIILLVFAFLRSAIYRRKNRMMPEEVNIDSKGSFELDVASRRRNCPEAYDSYYMDIASALGVSDRMVSYAVDTLHKLGLIYFESLPRVNHGRENGTDDWRTDHTIFCNMYKREGSYLLASGSDYYNTEVKNKKIKLKLIREKTGFCL